MHGTLGKADIAIDRGDDLRDRNRFRPSGQTIPTRGAPGSRHEAGMREGLQQLGNGRLGQPRRRGGRARGYLTIGKCREVGSDNDPIIGELAEDNHRLRRHPILVKPKFGLI